MADGPRRRLLLLITLLVGCVIAIVGQLIKVQIVDHQSYEVQAERQHVRAVMLDAPPRGVIRDRDGHLLAGNGVRYSIEAAPASMKDVVMEEGAVAELARVLHMPVSYVEALLNSRDENGDLRQWIRVAAPVSEEVGEKVAKLGIAGITVRPLWAREYPEGALASHALGFSTVVTGYYGIEGFYDAMLQPEPVKRVGPVDIASAPVPWKAIPVELPQKGVDLALTLDRTVQAVVEGELARAVWEYQADGGTIIVMEPETFGILAIASTPSYDPERYVDFTHQKPPPFEDPAISKQYEPGSVFKILTVAAALDAGIVAPGTTYYDQGWIEVGGRSIQNASRQAYGEVTVTDILVESLNVGAAWLNTQMGADVFYRYVQDFGIGQPTGVDLAGEITGQLWLPDDYEHWHPSNLGTNAFGQGVAVTPLQMVTAVATVANGGVRMRPHVVGRRIAPDGKVSVFQPVVEKRAISPETAATLTEMLVQVVDEGVPLARVEGYRVAGKTGTAQIPIPGGYDPEETIATFVGFGPCPEPTGGSGPDRQLVILVKLDRPRTSPWASKTAAPTFQRLASRLFTILGIPPQGGGSLVEAGQ